MSKSYYRSKPAAMVLTVIALSFVLPDSAVAETDTVAKAISSARVRRIARGVANQEISKRAPGLSVGSAVSAQSANTANTVISANPLLFARVAVDGTVDPANSKGISSGNVTRPFAALYCFSGLPAIKGGQVTPEIIDGVFQIEVGQLGLGSQDLCPAATQFFVITFSRDADGDISFSGGLSSSTCTSSGSAASTWWVCAVGPVAPPSPVPRLAGHPVTKIPWAV